MFSKPIPRELDRLRGRSPLSPRKTMNSRRTQAFSPRTGVINGSITKKTYVTPSKSSSASTRTLNTGISCSSPNCTPVRNTPSTKPTRNTPIRPRVNTAIIASPRKVSAPGKIINVISGSLDSLPETVTVRRKISTPVRSVTPCLRLAREPKTHSHVSSHVTTRSSKRTSPCNTGPTVPFKKFSAPPKLFSCVADIQRISKDHTSSGFPSASAPSVGATGTLSTTDGAKLSKKGAYAIPDPPSNPLPVLKEEKKHKAKNKKMNSDPNFGAMAPAEPFRLEDRGAGVAPTHLSSHHNIESSSAPKHDALKSGAAEKHNLERMVSDLIKNSECKKQEIAALKMEINRLKEVIRDRQSLCSASSDISKDDCGAAKDRSAKQSGASCPSTEEENDSTSRLESIVESLTTENRLLRDHLRHLGVTLDSSPLSDQQKEMILSRVSSAFSQSGGCPENLSSGGGEKDWDNKSSSSLSEISVACLQGRIQQMEETHYSTHEELQATLQELDDLREQLSECRMEIQQMQEEKQVLLESLTQQTEKLTEARGYNDTLKLMLIQHSENSQNMSQCERTQRLMELLKSVQEDKELVQVKQDEIEHQMQVSKEAEEHFHREAQLIRDRMKLLESMVESATNDKHNVESQLMEAEEIIRTTEKESTRMKNALTAAKEKIAELESAVISGEKSELADVLERVCAEKESSEKETANLQRKVNNLICENDRLKDQVVALKENLRVTRNNAKTNLDDVEWHRTQLDERRRELELEIATLKATLTDAQMTCQHHLEDKRDLKTSLSELQKKISEATERQSETERGFVDERAAFAKQVSEWEQFQRDLLTSVRVANDFKTEAQKNLERIEQENLVLRERIKQLELDLDKSRATNKFPSPSSSSLSTISAGGPGDRRIFKGVSNGESILGDRRSNPRPLARGDSRVKSLIESIECATKQAKTGSRSSSTSSLASCGSENNNNNNNNNNNTVKSQQQLRRTDTENMLRNLPCNLSSISPLKDSMSNVSSSSPLRTLNCNTFVDSISPSYSCKQNPNSTNLPDTVKMSQLSNEKLGSKYSSCPLVESVPTNNNTSNSKQPLSILSNKIDPIRRSSFNSMVIGDKKDPLAHLAQTGGSKRNALLKWCQNKTLGFKGVDITNFSSSWNDGLAFCALLATYLPDKIDYANLNASDKRINFEMAFAAAESVGIPTILDVNDLIVLERPSWQSIFNYVTSIYAHFET